ncbi:MAG: 50S ribosomal protein L19 [Alphaproteobacteria bacterium]|nr:50S ribosomal protein L19 [Alphaproteobacteria bacterium]MCD8526294.1 50S ribosomal protein L19 [Alphaproteobacteria bacterium]MCD8569924.1 50S ribosomal protein L19 [Alphaproteobacteria bacterium]
MNIVQKFEAKELAKYQAQKSVPDFAPGDTVKVNVKVSEGGRERIQAYEGVCISREGHGVNESFCVRKISYGEGVERVFPLWSSRIDSIELIRRGSVRRAKLYYLRDLRGKSARISERTTGVGIEAREELAEGVTKTALKKAKKAEKLAKREEARKEVEAKKAADLKAKQEAEAAEKAAAEAAAKAEADAAAAAEAPAAETSGEETQG